MKKRMRSKKGNAFSDFNNMKISAKPKKGLSPVVATVLLIVLVFVLAAIVFLWARGFLGEQIEKFGKPIEDSCKNAAFNFELYQPLGALPDEYMLEIVNTGNVPFYGVEIKQIMDDGNSYIGAYNFDGDLVAGAAGNLDIFFDEGTPKEIIIYPQILGKVKGKQSNQAFTCTDYGKVKKL